MPHKIRAKPLRAKLPSNKMPPIFSKITTKIIDNYNKKMAIGNINYRPSHTREPPRFKKLNIFKKNLNK